MILNELSLTGFRNYKEKNFSFDHRGAFFSGKNGTGKTNILEAMYTLAFAKSFRTNRVDDLIGWGEKDASVSALYTDDNGLQNELQINFDKKKRAVW